MPSESNDLLPEVGAELSKGTSIQLKLLVVAGLMFVLAGVAFFSMELTVRASGIVLRHEEMIHFAPADGVLNSIGASQGDTVEAGEFLCSLDDSEIRLGLLQNRRERDALQFALSENEAKLKEALVRPADRELVNSPERLRLLSEISSIQQGYLNSLRDLVEQNAVSQTKYQEQMVENLRVELDRSDAAERVRWIESGILDIERSYLALENERLQSEIGSVNEEIAIRERIRDSYRISAMISGRVTDLSFPYVGMAVKKGEPILKVSNLASPYTVIAQVGERNFDLIKVGTSVRMESKVFDSILEGFILGKVTKIDPEGKQEIPGADGDVTFEIEIEVDEAPHPLVLGSSIDVYFLLGRRSLLKTLFDQPEKPRS